jgi:hypothetical protein
MEPTLRLLESIEIIPSTVFDPDSENTYTVVAIGNYAFQGRSGMTSVTIGNGVTSIGPHAFDGCTGLTSVSIPNSVTTIEDSAFIECSGVFSAYFLGNYVSYIGEYNAFKGNVDTTIYVRPNTGWGTTWGGCTVSKTLSIHNHTVYFRK